MYCSNCGNKIDDNDKFCRSCGKSVLSNANEIVVEDNTVTQADSSATQPPYCTNCGKSVGPLKICPSCHLKTKKSYKKYCRYCGGIITENKKCKDCGSPGKISFAETIIRFFITILFVVNYVYAAGCIFVAKMIVEGITVLIGTLLVHIFIYRKKSIQNIKIKLLHKNARKTKLSLIYVGVFFSMFLILILSAAVSDSPLGNFSNNSQAVSYSENIVRKTLKNPSSMKINKSKVEESFTTDDGWTYYKVVIDYSAQNGFGGYNRDTEEIYVRSLQYSGIIEQISATEYVSTRLSK